MIAHNATPTPQTFDVQVGDRHFSATLAAGAAATFRWRAPDAVAPAANLGWVDLDYGPGPDGTPTGRLTASVGPEVVGALNQVKLGERWVGYTQPYAAELRSAGTTQTLPRIGWTASTTGMNAKLEEPTINMLDGNPATRWSSGTGQTADDAAPMSVTVDLNGSRTFSEIALDTAASQPDFLRRYLVEVFQDGTWKEIARGTGKPTTQGIMSILLPTTIGTKLRLTSDGEAGSWWSIHEFKLRLAEGVAATTPGPGLVTDTATLGDGTSITGYYNAGSRPAIVPWPATGFGYTYWLPPRAAVTFALPGSAAGGADRAAYRPADRGHSGRIATRRPILSIRCSGLPNRSDQSLPSARSSGVRQVDNVIMARVGVTPTRPGTAADCLASDFGDRKDVRRVSTIRYV